MYRLLGGALMLTGMLVVGAINTIDRSANYVSMDAEVYLIDRVCNFTTTTTFGGKTTKQQNVKKSCNSTGEFRSIRADPDNPKFRVDGKATVHVYYTSPVDQSTLRGELKFDGTDREFYALNAHDKIKILVSKSDPNKIKL